MFMFMNGELVIDLGGVHGQQSAALNLRTVGIHFDTLWKSSQVFMNGELVIDLGGVHGKQSATLNLRMVGH